MKSFYLGDSVYVEVLDRDVLKLTTNNGYPDDPRNVIYLEPSVWNALKEYIAALAKAEEQRQLDTP